MNVYLMNAAVYIYVFTTLHALCPRCLSSVVVGRMRVWQFNDYFLYSIICIVFKYTNVSVCSFCSLRKMHLYECSAHIYC